MLTETDLATLRAQLVREHQRYGPDVAADAAQDALCALVAHVPSLDTYQDALRWCRVVAWRSQARRPYNDRRGQPRETTTSGTDHLASQDPGPLRRAMAREELRAVLERASRRPRLARALRREVGT